MQLPGLHFTNLFSGSYFFAGWTFRIFFIFFLLGGGERGVRGAGRGWGTIFIENPRGGGLPGGAGRG